jgi:hypothetical protein
MSVSNDTFGSQYEGEGKISKISPIFQFLCSKINLQVKEGRHELKSKLLKEKIKCATAALDFEEHRKSLPWFLLIEHVLKWKWTLPDVPKWFGPHADSIRPRNRPEVPVCPKISIRSECGIRIRTEGEKPKKRLLPECGPNVYRKTLSLQPERCTFDANHG